MSEIITNEQGGKQSAIRGRITEVPPLALLVVSEVMALGATRYPREPDGTPNWHKIDSSSNLDHALEHAANFLALRNEPDMKSLFSDMFGGGKSACRDIEAMREELSHFAARAMMAMEMFELENPR